MPPKQIRSHQTVQPKSTKNSAFSSFPLEFDRIAHHNMETANLTSASPAHFADENQSAKSLKTV